MPGGRAIHIREGTPFEKETLQLDHSAVGEIVGQLVERTVDHYLVTHDHEVAKRWYPDTDDLFSVRRFRPKPLTPRYNRVGTLTGGSRFPRAIRGWSGDIALLVDDKGHGRRALIFEVKYGDRKLSQGQKGFFGKVLADPVSCLPDLKMAKVVLVRCSGLYLGTVTLKVLWTEYVQDGSGAKNGGYS